MSVNLRKSESTFKSSGQIRGNSSVFKYYCTNVFDRVCFEKVNLGEVGKAKVIWSTSQIHLELSLSSSSLLSSPRS